MIKNKKSKIKVRKYHLILIILLLIFTIFILKKNMNITKSKFHKYINILLFDVGKYKNTKNSIENGKNEQSNIRENIHKYKFDLDNLEILSDEIKLCNTIDINNIEKKKIAPGTFGYFLIKLDARKCTKDLVYKIKFEDVTKEKPSNLVFQINNLENEFVSLQELEQYLIGGIKHNSEKEIIINWKWKYETGKTNSEITYNNRIDTEEGINLKNYKFKIIVIGEEKL